MIISANPNVSVSSSALPKKAHALAVPSAAMRGGPSRATAGGGRGREDLNGMPGDLGESESPQGRIKISRIWWTNFFRSPRQVGSIMPSSLRLAKRVARQAAAFLRRGEVNRVIEVGAGTGAITGALMTAIPHQRLTLVEADPACCRWLRRRFPQAEIVEGLVEDILPRLLVPCHRLVLVSSVPLFSLNGTQRDRVLGAFEALVGCAAASRIVQYTYVPWLPNPRARALFGHVVQSVARNIPPAWVWSSTREARP
jgi:phosphatidylethanolamine/phosphatidyl-N-methylethanolamine N-methyltransferase